MQYTQICAFPQRRVARSICMLVFACLMVLHASAFANSSKDNKSTSAKSSGSTASQAHEKSAKSSDSHPEAEVAQPVSAPAAERNTESTAPRIIVTPAPPAPKDWSLHEKILWAAQVFLAIFGYAGIFLGYRLMRKIEEQTHYVEATATAALDCAHAVKAGVENQYRSERPWLLVSVNRSARSPEEFDVVLSNRGRIAAEILNVQEKIGLSGSSKELPTDPEYARDLPDERSGQMILLPGETMVMLSFQRSDVRWICRNSDQKRQQVEEHILHIFLYGLVTYRCLDANIHDGEHTTSWCCRYMHGETKYDLVLERIDKYGRRT